MKKIIRILTSLSLILSLSGCGASSAYLNWDEASTGQKTAAVLIGIVTLGIYPIIYVGGNIFGASAGASSEEDVYKDLEGLGADLEKYNNEELSARIYTNFGLSQSRSEEVARIIHHYNKLYGSRSITDEDAKRLYDSVLGVSFQEIREAVKERAEGNEEVLEGIYERIAFKNETSPEHIRDLVEQVIEGY